MVLESPSKVLEFDFDKWARTLYLIAVFYNRGSAEPFSASSIQGFRQIELRNGNKTAFVATRCVCWALSVNPAAVAGLQTSEQFYLGKELQKSFNWWMS